MKYNRIPEFHFPTAIYIENDLSSSASTVLKELGDRFLVIITSTDLQLFSQNVDTFIRGLKSAGNNVIVYDNFPGEPTTEDIDPAVTFAQKTSADAIIGIGGVYSINAAKAVALLMNNNIFCHDLLYGTEDPKPPMPLVTVPAYPIFGFEIAPLFFVNEIESLTKKSYFDYALYPHTTIIDPVISTSIRGDMSTQTGIAPVALATEAIISHHNNDIANTFALKSIDFIFRNLGNVYSEPENPVHRQPISTASLMAGMAFASSQSSLTLSISMALSSYVSISLEKAMSIILPHIMEYNLTTSPGKYVQMSKVMGEDVRDITVIEAAIKAVEAIRKLETDLGMPQRLSHYEMDKSIFRKVAELTMTYPFLEHGPRAMNAGEIETILIAAY